MKFRRIKISRDSEQVGNKTPYLMKTKDPRLHFFSVERGRHVDVTMTIGHVFHVTCQARHSACSVLGMHAEKMPRVQLLQITKGSFDRTSSGYHQIN